MFEYKKGKEDDYLVQNIFGIKKDKQEDFEQFEEFLKPYMRIAWEWSDNKRVKQINNEFNSDILHIEELDFFKKCMDEDNFSGISDLNKLVGVIKGYRICDKKSKFEKLLYELIKCRRVN